MKPNQHVEPWSPEEAAALDEVKANPAAGETMQLRAGELNDNRWPAEDDWIKLFKKFTSQDDDIEIHWVYNTRTGWADDFKFESDGYLN